MVHVPAVTGVTVVTLLTVLTVHISGVFELKATVRPEVALADITNGVP
jgi:hypothetical protein